MEEKFFDFSTKTEKEILLIQCQTFPRYNIITNMGKNELRLLRRIILAAIYTSIDK